MRFIAEIWNTHDHDKKDRGNWQSIIESGLYYFNLTDFFTKNRMLTKASYFFVYTADKQLIIYIILLGVSVFCYFGQVHLNEKNYKKFYPKQKNSTLTIEIIQSQIY